MVLNFKFNVLLNFISVYFVFYISFDLFLSETKIYSTKLCEFLLAVLGHHTGLTLITFVANRYCICGQLLHLWSRLITFVVVITFVVNYYICGFYSAFRALGLTLGPKGSPNALHVLFCHRVSSEWFIGKRGNNDQ